MDSRSKGQNWISVDRGFNPIRFLQRGTGAIGAFRSSEVVHLRCCCSRSELRRRCVDARCFTAAASLPTVSALRRPLLSPPAMCRFVRDQSTDKIGPPPDKIGPQDSSAATVVCAECLNRAFESLREEQPEQSRCRSSEAPMRSRWPEQLRCLLFLLPPLVCKYQILFRELLQAEHWHSRRTFLSSLSEIQ